VSVGRILTLGLGGLFSTVNFLPTLGYGSGSEVPPIDPPIVGGGAGGGELRKSGNYVSLGKRYGEEYRRKIDAQFEKPLPQSIAIDVASEIWNEIARSELDLQQSLTALQEAKNSVSTAQLTALRIQEIETEIAAIEAHMDSLRDDELLIILALSV
jgi:hypothetical protein